MYQLYFTQSGAAWNSKQLIWQSDMAISPEKNGIYDMKCSVEINKASELSFVMTQSCSSYNLFSKERSVLTLVMDGNKTIFRGVVKLIETDLFFQRTITANSDLVYLSDSVFEPHGDDIEEKPPERFKRILDHHNVEMQGDPEKQIQVGDFTFTDGANDVEKYTKNGGYKDTMSQLQNDFKDFYGFYQIRYNEDYSQKWLDYTESTGKSTSQDIKFAVNIEDYQFKDTVDDLFTILIPVGSDNLMLENQNEHRTVDIRLPDQSKRTIDLYIVDRYIKIVEGITAYGYIYQAESFTVDSNNIGKSGTDGRVGGGSSGTGTGSKTAYEYLNAYVGGDDASIGHNPKEEGLYYYNGSKFVLATETTPVTGRTYVTQNRPTYYKADTSGTGINPMRAGWREYRNGRFAQTTDTTVVAGKTYYSSEKPSSGGGGGGSGSSDYKKVIPKSNSNPAAEGWYYIDNGVYVPATETTVTKNRAYFEKIDSSGGGGGGGGGDSEATYTRYSTASTDNPKALGLYEKRAFTINTYQLTNDTRPIPNKAYYRKS